MINKVKILSDEEIMDRISEELLFPDLVNIRNFEVVIAEYIRYLLTIETQDYRPIHINRIIRQISNRFHPLLEEVDVSPIQDLDKNLVSVVLEKLVAIKEIEHIGNGFYLPTPTRIVPLPSGRGLILSSLPFKELTSLYGITIIFSGICRMILEKDYKNSHKKITIKNGFNIEQQFIDWIEVSNHFILDWMKSNLEFVQKKLKPTYSTTESVEIYNPLASSSNLQALRWTCLEKNMSFLQDMIFLCRTKTLPRRHWLSHIQIIQNKPTLVSEMDIPTKDIRRYMYGMDALWNKATIVYVNKYDQDSISLLFQNPLPDEEMRFFLSLGTDISKDKGKLPYRFKLPNDCWFDAKKLLSNLGIQISSWRG